MMKTLKFIVLLTVMLVNVTPYIKDGKLQWKATQAAAQYYTIEDTGMGIWICGSEDDPFITLISRIDCYDLLPSQVSDEEAEFEDCFCEYCGIQKEYCQEPCLICGSTATVDEDGNDYPGPGNNTENNDGSSGTISVGEVASNGWTTINPSNTMSQDCAPLTFSYSMNITNLSTSNTLKRPWCVFYIKDALDNGAPKTAEQYATEWLKIFNDDRALRNALLPINERLPKVDSFQDFDDDFTHNVSKLYIDKLPNISFGTGVSDACSLIENMAPNNKGLLVYKDNISAVTNKILNSHVFVIYSAFRYETSEYNNVVFSKFDTYCPLNGYNTSDFDWSFLDLGTTNYIITSN